MEFQVIGTGSKGNAYILRNEDEVLLIECGVNIDEIKKALNYNYSNVVGCIVTHEHNDHAKSINELMKLGIEIYATEGTYKGYSVNPAYKHRAFIVKPKKIFRLSKFTIIPFDVKHDAQEPVGFLINHPETGKVLFMTDTIYCKYKFEGLTSVIIEANYSKEIIDRKYGPDSEKYFLRNRILKSHMSLENCIGFLKANDLSDTEQIILIHLSDSNSHEKYFKQKVQEATGKLVEIANNGQTFNLNQYEPATN
jgi:phosphoribosyl 1,2-cyclic phosphodiesterase